MKIRPGFTTLLVLAVIALLSAGPMLVRAQDAAERPTGGFDLHIDAKYHFPGDGQVIAHHWCKALAGFTECLIFDGDGPDARMVGVEIVIDTATYESLPAEEQALWHYHREEIPLVEATLPDLSEEEAAQVAEGLMETYGKVYLIWDPTEHDMPMGQPFIPDVHANVMADATPSPEP